MLMATGAQAQKGSENGLIGIKLYDSGARVVSLYGTPDQIQPVSVGTGSASGGGSPFGGGGSPFGGAPGGMPGPKGGGGMPGASGTGADVHGPFDFGNNILQFGSKGPGGQGRPGGMPGGMPGGQGMPGPGPGGAGPGGVPGPPGSSGFGGGSNGTPRGGGGAAEYATYTRWIYNRSGSKYGFIIDKFGRVVQIEAIGLQNNKVRTRRGVGFGATFAQLIKKYSTPDGYEISGDNVLVKFLTKNRVAFRLTRLGEKKPQVVTGIVVAAAKG
ncbi:hypothetical protein OP10G_3505 [Fimbriimonas ginsengisoli Gsoil 348]|uniref:Uncharacterized protein n=2 Tax=Fimbriimonas ginsengisoli TaxID=1005039 RepID=A0A068NTJ1_FIMGI|nr:hypothetical protein OP10G_3505 [Fimbriimonas ginsengisoli Gsoil 348]